MDTAAGWKRMRRPAISARLNLRGLHSENPSQRVFPAFTRRSGRACLFSAFLIVAVALVKIDAVDAQAL